MFAPYTDDGMGQRYFGKPSAKERFCFALDDARTFTTWEEAEYFLYLFINEHSTPGFPIRGGVQEV